MQWFENYQQIQKALIMKVYSINDIRGYAGIGPHQIFLYFEKYNRAFSNNMIIGEKDFRGIMRLSGFVLCDGRWEK